MKVNDLISLMLNCELVIVNCDNVRIFDGTVCDLKRHKKYLDYTIVEMYIQADSLILNTRHTCKDIATKLNCIDFGNFLFFYRE